MTDPHAVTLDAWDSNAAYWDEYMGEGNAFVTVLQWPAIERMLPVQPGMRILDIATGNGLMARRLGRLGAQVTAIDFAPQMIETARRRTTAEDGSVTYAVADVTDEEVLMKLGEAGSFDAALCNMALFDISDIDPLFRALSRLLRPGGTFVYTLMHPCFNNPFSAHMAEQEDREGELVTTYSVRVWGYMTSANRLGLALSKQPKPQVYFHRPLQMLFVSGFATGFVIDALEERAFPVTDVPKQGKQLGWNGNYSEIPPVMVVRMRLGTGD
ncbi:methyltransferase domain-containing protein [bacterium]|nr:methyltransferase domain-containing protein [bacterium]